MLGRAADKDVSCGPHYNVHMWRPNSNTPESSHWSHSATPSQENPTLSFYGPACTPDFLNSSKPLPQLTACVYSSLIPHTHGPQKVLFACPIKNPLNFPKVAHIIKITIKKKNLPATKMSCVLPNTSCGQSGETKKPSIKSSHRSLSSL